MRELLLRGIAVLSVITSGIHLQAGESPIYPEAECVEAENTATMYLFPQQGKLIGWVTEVKAGQKVVIEAGKEQVQLETNPAGSFEWQMDDSTKAQTIHISYGEIARVVTVPAKQANSPVAFFVIDRSVCRKNTSFQFAAFLR